MILRDLLAGESEENQGVGALTTPKAHAHDREVVVFELAAPDDATDSEFAEFDSLLNAFYAGAHADGYLGYGDAITVKVKTRLDNLGDVESAMDDSLYEDGNLVSFKKQMETMASWDGDDSQFYATAHETKLNWLSDDPADGAWDHIYDDGFNGKDENGNDLNSGENTGFGKDENGNPIDPSSAGGSAATKPKLEDDQIKTLIGTSFHGQSVNRFFRAG